MGKAYYNEIDHYAAQWLRNLISAGHIAPGDVDERSIVDVRPSELAGYTQCHFFAGIGVWSYALRLAGWPDDRPVWTGSCPCQPFSAAGKRGGVADERHLWPAWFHLIGERRPERIFGEQVASKDGLGWLDLVQADLEAADYACGFVDTCSAGSGAPHIRQRLRFVAERRADADQQQLDGSRDAGPRGRGEPANSCNDGGMADADQQRRNRLDASVWNEQIRDAEVVGSGEAGFGELGSLGGVCGLSGEHGRSRRPGPTNGFWRDADWLFCRDGKWRPVEPGTFPLAHGAPARVGRLRAYGNAVDAQATRVFIEAYCEAASGV